MKKHAPTIEEQEHSYLYSKARYEGKTFQEWQIEKGYLIEDNLTLGEILGRALDEMKENDTRVMSEVTSEEAIEMTPDQRAQILRNTYGDDYLTSTFHELDDFEDDQATDEIQMAVDPGHYKSVACGKQYIELMEEILDGHSGVDAHLLGQTYKYMMRLGKKDNPEQDAKKAAFYLMCLVQKLRGDEINADKVQSALKQL